MTYPGMPQVVPIQAGRDIDGGTTLRDGSVIDASGFGTVGDHLTDPPEEFDVARGTHASPTQRGTHAAAASESVKPQGRWSRRVNQFMTLLAFGVASALSAEGMWLFMERTLHMNELQRIGGFAIFEILMLTSGLRARALRLRSTDASRWTVDGLAVWVFAGASGVFSASETTSVWGALARLIIALSSAFMLERLIVEERAAKFSKRRKPRWLQKLLVRAGWHDPQNKTLVEIDEARRLARLATLGFEAITATHPKAKARAVLRYRRALARANERIEIATDPDKIARLRASVALLTHGLDRIAPDKVASASPWAASERADKTARQNADNSPTEQPTNAPTGRADKPTGRPTGRPTNGSSVRPTNADRTPTGKADSQPTNGGGHSPTALADAARIRATYGDDLLVRGSNGRVRKSPDDGGLGLSGDRAGPALSAYFAGADRQMSGTNGHGGGERA